ncbi:MAG: hypothetical protein WB992_07940 [Bryobacteraceae bacterium]
MSGSGTKAQVPLEPLLTLSVCKPSVMGMQVQFDNPELQAKVEQWVSETGRPAEELVEDAMAGYFDELERVRETLGSRYDDIKTGKVKLISGDEAFARLRAKSEARRNSQA